MFTVKMGLNVVDQSLTLACYHRVLLFGLISPTGKVEVEFVSPSGERSDCHFSLDATG